MKMPDTVTVNHLVTTTIPVTVAAPSLGDDYSIVFKVTTGPPVSKVTRLTPTEAAVIRDLLMALAPTEIVQVLEETLTPVSQPADPDPAVDVDHTPATPGHDTASPTPKRTGHTNGGQRMTPESAAKNAKLRKALAEGKSMQEAADAAGMTYRAAQQRAIKYGLRPGAAPKKAAAPAAKAKPAGPVLRNPKPKPPVEKVAPAPDPVTHARPRVVPVLGARRRILALYAIGYDPSRLNARLNNTGVLVSQILADDVTEIDRRTHDTIVELFDHLKYLPVTASAAANVPRGFPPPGKWTNIDDPNEHHGEQL